MVTPPSDFDHSSEAAQMRVSGTVTLWFCIVCQVALPIACAIAWLSLGGWQGPLILGLIFTCTLSIVVDVISFRELHHPGPRSKGAWWTCLSVTGCGLLMFLGYLLFGLVYGISYLPGMLFLYPMLLFVIFREILELVRTHAGVPMRRVRRGTTWLLVWSSLVFGPISFGWIAASAAIPLARDEKATVRAWLDTHPRTERQCPQWIFEGEPLRVAVTLSGGGYRAALTHAGVLAALDEQCIPVDIVSSVSGGSIVGTSYVLGIPPAEFAHRLAEQRPGLPNNVLSLANVFRSTTETYQRFFRTAYFGEKNLQDLPEKPVLLLNVTNVYADPRQAREIFLKNWAPSDPAQIHLADVVAASGAYPGAFRPIEIGLDLPKIKEGPFFYVDGGVVENLGTEGVQTYLARMPWTKWYREHPRILIVSDATGYAGTERAIVVTPGAAKTLLRANDVQFDTLHRFIYQELIGPKDLPSEIAHRSAWSQYYVVDYPKRFIPRDAPAVGTRQEVLGTGGFKQITVQPETLRTVVIPITAEATRNLLDRYPNCVTESGETASSVQVRIRILPTLKELQSKDVLDAFWIGHSLGQIYGQAIQCARKEIEGTPCDGPPKIPAVACPKE